MNKRIVGVVLLAVIAVALLSVGTAAAQGPRNPQTPVAPGSGAGYGMGGRMAGQGGMTGPMLANGGVEGPLHDAMLDVYAAKLNLSVDALETRLANGETMMQIALAQGLTFTDFRALMVDARSAAADQAVKDGTLTQAQADWMKTRGAGQAGGGRGMRGMGQGLNPACPFNQ